MTARAFSPVLPLALAAAAACGPTLPPPVDLRATDRAYRAGDYRDAYRRWTRQASDRRTYDLAIDVEATFLSWDMRQAVAAREAAWRRLPADRAAALLQRQREELESWWEVVLNVRTSREQWNDLHSERSSWSAYLVDDQGRKAPPIRIRRVNVPTEVELALFPPQDEFFKMYRARFPRRFPDGTPVLGPGTRWFALHVAGPLGQVALRWEVRPATGS